MGGRRGWLTLGPAPIVDGRLPAAVMAWRISHDGFETLELLTGPRRQLMQFSLLERAYTAPGMARMAGRTFRLYNLPAVELSGYGLDRHEVTNGQYERFLQSPEYREEAFWRELLDAYAGTATLREAQRPFHDSTDFAGPSTWRDGRYPEGQANHPVGGVSWYEAVAYCAAHGKQLPTMYHWYSAAQPGLVQYVAQYSNFSGDGPVEIGAPLSLGGSGLYDMAGNVKEWTWNPTNGGLRFIVGGSWREGFEAFYEPDARPATSREPDHGFRCARYDEPPTAGALAFLDRPVRGISTRMAARVRSSKNTCNSSGSSVVRSTSWSIRPTTARTAGASNACPSTPRTAANVSRSSSICRKTASRRSRP